MPVQNTDNISLGLGTLEFGNIVNGAFQGYIDIGAIKSEVLIEHKREVLDFETGRPLAVILQEVIRETVTIAATLAEVTVATLKMALGQGNIGSGSTPTFLDQSAAAPTGLLATGNATVAASQVLKFGGSPTNAFIGLRFTHRKANGKRQIFEGYKASPMGDLTIPFKETDWQLFQVQFRLLADTSRPAGEQYYQLFIET